MSQYHAPCLDHAEAISSLGQRTAPYWHTLEYCRHLGVQRHPSGTDFWVARARVLTGGKYRQARLAPVDFSNVAGVDYEHAVKLAQSWFSNPKIAEIAAEPYPVGINQELRYVKVATGYTVGDAMSDYVEWKRVAAAKTHFDASLSLINHHIVPRLGNTLVEDLTARRLTDFMVDVLETPAKYGHQKPGPKRSLAELDPDTLRKRKKTANTLLGILRLALQMAWENGEFESERVWRTIRRLPHKDAPRQEFLNRDQCRLLLSHCRADLRLVVAGALYTGCRISELSALRVSDVEPGMAGIYVAPCKNYRGRYVVLPDEGLRFFRSQIAGKAKDDHVFLMNSGRNWNGNHKHLFRQAVRACGLSDRFVFHGLRHTYASQLVQAGTPLIMVAKQLGHSNADTVSRTYGHLCCSSMERELQRRFSTIEIAGVLTDAPLSTEDQQGFETLADGRDTSWPLSNFTRASGELIAALKLR